MNSEPKQFDWREYWRREDEWDRLLRDGWRIVKLDGTYRLVRLFWRSDRG